MHDKEVNTFKKVFQSNLLDLELYALDIFRTRMRAISMEGTGYSHTLQTLNVAMIVMHLV